MKNLLFWKRADIIGQGLALLIPIILGIAFDMPGVLIMCYFSVGGAQIISCLVNKISLNPQYKSSGRRVYEIVLLSIIILFLLLAYGMTMSDSAGNYFGWFAIAMLFVGPVMAICYASVTIIELHKIELDIIKQSGSTEQGI